MCTIKEEFVRNPNLPEGRVTLAAVSGQYPEIPEKLRELGIQCITTEPDNRLQIPVASHADMQMFHVGENRTFVLRGEQALRKQLEDAGFMVAETNNTPTAVYPGDVLCNALMLGDQFFGNIGTVDPVLYSCVQALNKQTMFVNQGYTRCSTAVISEKAIITMDAGMGAAARFRGLDVMIIPERSILLDGYDYGFIGGCCGLIDKNVLAFTGRLDSLNFEKPIRDFAEKHGVQIVELTQNPVIDIGGILPLKIAVDA